MTQRPVDAVLSRLARVRENGPDRWLACCPGHDDRNPSLSIRELDDGKCLIYCFAGCSLDEILGAIALDRQDLFPGRDEKRRLNPGRWEHRGPPIPARQVIEILSTELMIVAIAAHDVADGNALPELDLNRLSRAAKRIWEVAEYATER